MYRTCMFCKRPLGSNEVVESFPVGRRLAFDAAKGRLWVVCAKCGRWNLTPIEERWEAVEDCERIFRETRTRASTEHIGIARHKGGLDLVRIGKPPRGEFAAWRYGEQFRRRMRMAMLSVAGGVAGGAALVSMQVAWPVALGWLSSLSAYPLIAWGHIRTLAKVRVGGKTGDDGSVAPENVARFRQADLKAIHIFPNDDDHGFGIRIHRVMRKVWFEGEDARRVAAAVVPHLNGWGGSRGTIRHAVHEIEASGHPSRFLTDVANLERRNWTGSQGYIYNMPRPTRLALEMSLHEEQERRALEGELWILEQAWKEAEEIAAIADNLLLPARADEFFERHGRSP